MTFSGAKAPATAAPPLAISAGIRVNLFSMVMESHVLPNKMLQLLGDRPFLINRPARRAPREVSGIAVDT